MPYGRPGPSLQLTSQADFWHLTASGASAAARPARPADPAAIIAGVLTGQLPMHRLEPCRSHWAAHGEPSRVRHLRQPGVVSDEATDRLP